MQTTITLLRREQYGNRVYYPVCDQAHALAKIAGTKTLTAEVLRIARSMGFHIQVTTPDDEFQLEG